MTQAARRKRPQQFVQDAVAVLDEVVVEIGKPGALPRLHVIGGERVIEGRPPLGPQGLTDHDLDQAAQAADP